MATTEKVLRGQGNRNHVIHISSNGVANATATEIIDLSEVFPLHGKIAVEKIESNIWGFANVSLTWAFSTPEQITVLGQGHQEIDWTGVGGMHPSKTTASGTGDIMLATTATGNDALEESGYNVTLYCKASNSL